MQSNFEVMGGSYHQEGDYLLLNAEALEHRDYITEELKRSTNWNGYSG